MQTNNQGIKISFEGIDGCGKTTQSSLLEEYLSQEGYSVIRARDNSDVQNDSFEGQILRLLGKGGDRFFRIGNPVTENLLIAGRASYLDQGTNVPHLNSGGIVIADRDIDTFIAYGMPGLESAFPQYDADVLFNWLINLISLGRSWPDITILFEPRIGFLDRATAGVYDSDKKDLFTESDRNYIGRVIYYYGRLLREYPQRMQVIQAEGRSIEAVFSSVIDLVKPALETKNVRRNK